MKILPFFALLIVGLFAVSCSVEPVPIHYGQDACHFCEMNIVDRQHSAEIVTTKGKAYKYDAIECLLRDRKNWKEEDIAITLVADYSNPGEMIAADKATYLVCENIPSPMGANLSAFATKEKAESTQKEKGGNLFSWDEMKKRIH